MSDNYVLL